MKRWDRPQYQRMSGAQLSGEELIVSFEDDSSVRVPARRLLPPGLLNMAWDEMQVTPYEITIPTSRGDHAIPWTAVRLLTDSAFAAHSAQLAGEQARDIGIRLRAMRLKKGLTAKEVAERAGITPQSLSRIEHGRHDVVFTTLRKILAAMGCTLADLADVDPVPQRDYT